MSKDKKTTKSKSEGHLGATEEYVSSPRSNRHRTELWLKTSKNVMIK